LIVRSPIFRKLLLAAALLIAVTLATADVLLTRYTAERERSLVRQQMAQSLLLQSQHWLLLQSQQSQLEE